MECLVVYLQQAYSCVYVCNERYSHRVTGSVRKGLDILPHSFLLPCGLRYALPWQCMSRDRPAFGQITLHTYIPYSRPPLWYRADVVPSHAAGPGSIPGRISFLVEVFFLGISSSVRQIGNLSHIHTRSSYGHHMSSVFDRRRSQTISVGQFRENLDIGLKNKIAFQRHMFRIIF